MWLPRRGEGNIMKRLLKIMTAAALVLALTLTLGACNAGPKPSEQARAAVASMFYAVKTWNLEELRGYTDDADFLDDFDELSRLPGGEEFLKSVLGKVNCEILAAEQADKETVYVFTNVTAVDMKPVFGQFLTKAMEYAVAHMLDDPAPTDEQMEVEMMKILTELLAADELAMVTTDVVIPVRRDEAGWGVEASDDLLNAMLGGLEEALEELPGALG